MKISLNYQDNFQKELDKTHNGDTIYLKEGIYPSKLVIKQDNITIIGEGSEKTFITNKDYYNKIMIDNAECNTFRTYTVKVLGNHVTFKNLTIRNDSIPAEKYGQAVALHVSGDFFVCENCQIQSAQDTIFLAPYPKNLQERYQGFISQEELQKENLHQIFKSCTIIGDVDFIFGCGQAKFINCDIVSIGDGYISAPAHEKNTMIGFLFYQCNMIKKNSAQKVYLARPWRDYGLAFFYDCKYDDHILPLGFNKWNNSNRDKTARFYEYSAEIIKGRVPFAHYLTKKEADSLLDKWQF